MPIVISDIKFYLSGGSGNTDVDASLGGIISTTEVTTGTLHNLFDLVTGTEASAGDTEYRCIYVKNTHGSLSLTSSVAWLSSNTPSSDSTIDIGLGSAAIDVTEQTIVNESTAPTSITFSAPATLGAGLSIGTLAAGSYKSIWLRRTISASASAYATDTATLNVGGDTAA